MKALVDWIKAEMEALGTPPAYSYQVGKIHGMEKVLKEIESGKYQQLTEKDATIRKAIHIWETAQTEDDFDDIMHAVIDELKAGLGEGDKE